MQIVHRTLELWKQIRYWIIPVLAVVLAIVLFVFQVTIDFRRLSGSLISINLAFAILISIVVTLVLLFLYFTITVTVPKLLTRLSVWITLKTVTKAITNLTGTVQASSITTIGDDVGIDLPLGFRDGVMPGDRFIVLATAREEKWGVLEASEVRDTYSVCSVSDRINPEFWADLERRMRYDPSPPQGITIRREIPEEALYEWLTVLLKGERG